MPSLPPLSQFPLLAHPRDLHFLVHYLDYQGLTEDYPIPGFLDAMARNLERALRDKQDPFCFQIDQTCAKIDFQSWLDGSSPFED